MMNNRYVFDIECDNLYDDVTKIWCLVAKDIDQGGVIILTKPDVTSIRSFFRGASLLIGHGIIDYDLAVIEKLLGVKYGGRIFDTLVASRLLNPDRVGGHSLDSWGKRLNMPKGDHSDWSCYSPEMLRYCRQDVLINEKVYRQLEPIIRG